MILQDNNLINNYIATFPESTQELLLKLRSVIIKAVPEAIEVLSYRMPAYKLRGRILLYFAGHEKHIGFYPGVSAKEAFKDELSGYKGGKGTIQFPIDKPLPLELINKIVRFRVNENLEKLKNKTKKK